jgi:hypothetical protein
VHGCIFTRGPKDLRHTAIFVGGTDMGAGEQLFGAVRKAFFGPMRVSGDARFERVETPRPWALWPRWCRRPAAT